MVMQSSGPISMGQAMEECQLAIVPPGQPVSQALLSRLAGVSPGQEMAFSDWYGKSNLVDINNVVFATASAHVDRNFFLTVNFRTGAMSWTANGNGGPHLTLYTQEYPTVTLAAQYKAWSASIQFVAGSTGMTLSVTQQPSPANDFTAIFLYDDNGPSGQHDTQANLIITFTP